MLLAELFEHGQEFGVITLTNIFSKCNTLESCFLHRYDHQTLVYLSNAVADKILISKHSHEKKKMLN